MSLPSEPINRKEQYLAKIAGQDVEIPSEPLTREEAYLDAIAKGGSGGGGGGTSNYESLSNQPQINGETLIGNKTGAELGLVDAVEGKGLSTNDYDDNEKAAVAAATSAISAMKDGTDLDSFGDVEVALLDKADVSDLGTAAAKNSTNAVTSGSTDLVESGAVKDAIDAAVAAAYHHAGTKTVAQLTHDLLIAANEGNVYNITDSGTTTSDFIEGIGKTIDEGSNVGICKVGNAYMFDLLSGFVDTTNFVQKSQTAGLLKNDGTVNTTIEDDVNQVKSGLTDLSDHVDGDATTYPYADVITIEDAIPANLADCSVKVEPVQDLHGYDKPWVGGAGKNIFINSNQTYQNAEVQSNVFSDERILGTATGTYYLSFEYKVLTASGNSQSLFYGKYNGSRISGGNIGNWVDSTVSSDWVSKSFTLNLGNNVINGIELFSNNALAVRNIMISATPITAFEPYENICPIAQYDSCKITRIGKNLFNTTMDNGTAGGITYTKNADGSVSVSGTRVNATPKIIGEVNVKAITGTLFISGLGSVSGMVVDQLILYDNDNNILYRRSYSLGKVILSDYPTADRLIVSVKGNNNGTVASGKITIQAELAEQATAWEPYKGNDYQIELNGNTYYGKVRIDTQGNVYFDVDRSIVDLGSLTWQEDASASHSRFVANKTGMKKDGIVTADCFQSGTYNEVYSHIKDEAISIYDIYSQFAIHSTYCETNYDAAQFKEAMSGHYACYELATPFTITLKDTPINLVKGQNTIYADTGDIEVTVNNTMDAIGSVQEQVNGLDAKVPDAPSTDGTYSLQVTVADGEATYSWESAE